MLRNVTELSAGIYANGLGAESIKSVLTLDLPAPIAMERQESVDVSFVVIEDLPRH